MKQNVSITLKGGDVINFKAIVIGNVFIIHREIDYKNGILYKDGNWQITHLPTSSIIIKLKRGTRYSDAVQLTNELLEINVDWLDHNLIYSVNENKDGQRDKIKEIIKKYE